MRWGVLVLAALWTYTCHTLLGRVISLLVICAFLYWLAPSQHPIKQQIARVLSFNSREEEADDRKKHKRNRRYLCTDRFNVKKIPPKVDTVVIGSGMSGLTCAAVLSRLGRRVLVLEQHTIAGGGTHSFDLQGFRFDAGLHYTVPWSVPLFHLACGPRYKDLKDNAELEKIPIFARLGGRKGEEGEETFDKVYLWNEGSNEVPVPFLMKQGEKHLEDLYKLFPKEKAALDAYLKLTDRVMFSLLPFAISKLLPLWLQQFWWKLCLGTFKTYGGRTAKEVLGELTDDSRLVALLCGLWIDTGTRPDRATFFLTASVFRGLAKEGAVYPEGGSETMARCLVDVIEANGGKVLTRASVSRILVEQSNDSVTSSSYRVTGVLVNEEVEIPADLIVSSAGYHNTFGKLLPEEVVSGVGMPRCVPGVGDSAGFVMCNVGIRGNSRELDIPNCNLWVHPVNRDTGDMFGPLEKFFSDPLAHDPLPAMITFPSLKDRLWETKHSDKMSCQILVMADHAWFEKFKDMPSGERGEEYENFKQQWQEKCLQLLFRLYPQLKDRVEFVNVSTPLSIEYYLRVPRGGAVGLDQTPQRYTDWEVVKCLDLETKLHGLFLTGQDTLVCGVTLAQMAGFLTALRIVGPLASTRLLLQNFVFG